MSQRVTAKTSLIHLPAGEDGGLGPYSQGHFCFVYSKSTLHQRGRPSRALCSAPPSLRPRPTAAELVLSEGKSGATGRGNPSSSSVY